MLNLDYNKTIEKFLVDVEMYLTHSMEAAKDKATAAKIQKTRFGWGMIKAAPRKHINDKRDYLNKLSVYGFVRGNDDSAYRAVISMLDEIRILYTFEQNGWAYTHEQQERFLNVYKRWKCKSATGILERVVFPFRSPEYFAVRSKEEIIK